MTIENLKRLIFIGGDHFVADFVQNAYNRGPLGKKTASVQLNK